MDQTKQPVVIKKYANRRLYNTETSTYVTLEDLAAMVRSERDFVVYDAKTNEDLTHSVLTQIILEQESRGQNLLPINFLRQLIRFYGDNMGRLVPAYLDLSLGMLTREQEKFRKQLSETWGATPFGASPFGAAALEAMQDQARQNMALFEKAITSMWAPFTQAAGAGAAGKNGGEGESRASGQDRGREAGEGETADEISELKDQLAQMQRRLDRLSRG